MSAIDHLSIRARLEQADAQYQKALSAITAEVLCLALQAYPELETFEWSLFDDGNGPEDTLISLKQINGKTEDEWNVEERDWEEEIQEFLYQEVLYRYQSALQRTFGVDVTCTVTRSGISVAPYYG